MTLDDYMDREKFPMTSQGGLAADQQMLIDAFNHDQLKEFLEEGGEPSERQKAIWKELQEKIPAQPELLRQLRDAKGAGSS